MTVQQWTEKCRVAVPVAEQCITAECSNLGPGTCIHLCDEEVVEGLHGAWTDSARTHNMSRQYVRVVGNHGMNRQYVRTGTDSRQMNHGYSQVIQVPST